MHEHRKCVCASGVRCAFGRVCEMEVCLLDQCKCGSIDSPSS